MRTIQDIRNDIIDKILSIKEREALLELDQLLDTFHVEVDTVLTTEAQKAMLQMSEEDIKQGRLISQEDMVARNLEWLNEE